MNRKNHLRIIAIVGIVITFVVGLLAFRLTLNCCTPIQSTELTANSSDPVNKATVALLNQTQTAGFANDYSQPPQAYETQTQAYIVGLVLTARGLAISPTPPKQGAVASASLTPTASGTCAFRRAYQDLANAAQAAQDAFNDAGMKSIAVIHAEALGEDCETADGKVISFRGMSSDFYLSATVSSLDDTKEIAKVVKTAYSTITKLDLQPSMNLGYMDITIVAGNETRRFRATFSEIKAALKAEKGDASLLAAGGL